MNRVLMGDQEHCMRQLVSSKAKLWCIQTIEIFGIREDGSMVMREREIQTRTTNDNTSMTNTYT